MPAANTKTIEFIRLGNPWLVGKNVSRIVPVYALHNVLAPDFDREAGLQAIKDMAFDAEMALGSGLGERVSVSAQEYEELQLTVYGLLSPERRIFRDRARGGASKHGALFPLVAGLISPVASDDGLGRRMRSLLELHQGDWQARLLDLLVPASPRDPATAFAMALLRGSAGQQNPRVVSTSPTVLNQFDQATAQFVDNLIESTDDARRVAAIRNLAFGVYFAAVLRMVAGPAVEADGKLPLVLVYGGLPPGRAGDPLVAAACKSFQRWIATSWHATTDQIAKEIAQAPSLPKASKAERIRHQLRALLSKRLPPTDVDPLMEMLELFISRNPDFDKGRIREVLESKSFGFKKSELARRVRSLGGNIGLTGPDRGTGSPRLLVDTPLLAVLVRGVVGVGSMQFERFITEIAAQFGLVLGVGEDDSIVDRIEQFGSDGYDAYEILRRNEELIRERLIRAGLARAYSDSHTEVYNDA